MAHTDTPGTHTRHADTSIIARTSASLRVSALSRSSRCSAQCDHGLPLSVAKDDDALLPMAAVAAAALVGAIIKTPKQVRETGSAADLLAANAIAASVAVLFRPCSPS